uniref:FAD-binding PCMH-type domain-containing protein n=1 Tax=Ditylenchus dipsaci TaxID=166011 RepID=A0A915D0Y3_9BILA
MKFVLISLLSLCLVTLLEAQAVSREGASQHVVNIPGFPPIKFLFHGLLYLDDLLQKSQLLLSTTKKSSGSTKPSGSSSSASTTANPSSSTAKPGASSSNGPATSIKPNGSTPTTQAPDSCPGCRAPLLNWGGNFNFSTQDIKYPTTTAGVQQLVKECKGKIRPVGTRHSFSEIANTNDTLICLVHMNLILSVDPSVPSVTVQAGITYTDLIPFLQSIGLAIPMMASLGEISIAGAINTAVHGSGAGIGNLATQVLGLQMVLADGSVVQYSKGQNDTELAAATVGLGALGIVTQVTLQAQPTYNLAINVFENMDMSVLDTQLYNITHSGYAINMWSTFGTPGVLDQVWITTKVDSNGVNAYGNVSQLYGAPAATAQSSPIAALPPTYVVPQMGIVGPYYERLTDYDLGLSGQEGQQTQSEYYVDFDDFVPALKALQTLSAEINAVVYVALFRITEKDELWMSPQYKKTTMAIHFSWQPKLDQVMALLPKIEAALAPFNPIPHWGKLYTLKPEQYLPLLPKYPEWREQVELHDPTHKFRNKWLEENIFVV